MRVLAMLLVSALAAPSAVAGIVGQTVPAEPITEARIAQLPKSEQGPWLAYLARSKALLAADKAALTAERGSGPVPPSPPAGPSGSAGMPLDKPDWYAGAEARHNADTILSFQTPAGGWGKNVDRSGPARLPGQLWVPVENLPAYASGDIASLDQHWQYVGTIDNGATIQEMRFLARVQAALPGAEGEPYRAALRKGFAYLLAAQFPNGGWPQVYPLQGGYHDAITYNDDAMSDVLLLLSSAAERKGDYGFVSEALAADARAAVARAVRLILDTQVRIHGKRTVWGQQHDALTLAPVGARNFEPASLSSYESANLLILLMRLPDPSPEVVAAVRDGAAWLDAHALRDMEWTRAGEDGRKLVAKPGAGPIWSRFYDFASGKPVFGDRDKSVHDDVNELSLERRNGYSWFSAGPKKAIDLAKKWNPQSAATRAAALVAQMTLEEKAAQLKDGAPAIPRLGVPGYNWWNEGLHGVARAGNATVFPQAIGLAATWDEPLIHGAAGIVAREFRAKYRDTIKPNGSTERYRGLTVWSPNINIFRDPRWGRGQETFGEDPYLTGRFGIAWITGLQGGDPLHPTTIAAVKHFAVHSGPEADRHKDDIHPSAHDLEDTYLPAFRAAVTEGKAQALMCAYNAVYGVPACGMPMLEERVRKRWGFEGHIVSDCAAIADFVLPTSHGYVKTSEEAVAAALNAGTDLFCAQFGLNNSTDPAIIVNAVKQGLVREAVLDRALTRLFEARFRLGMFDPIDSGPYAGIAATDYDTPANRTRALEVSRASLVLLKNNGLLPLKAEPKRIAVIGPNADNIDALVGNYNGTPSNPVTLLTGIRQRFPRAEVIFVEGTGLVGVPLRPVPASAFCIDAACAARGVKVEEFATTDLSGPAKASTGTEVRFGWGRPARQERATSIRWSGFIVPSESGPFRFKLNSDNGYRILIDGRTVVGAWDAADPATIADGEIELRAGEPYALTVEAIQKGSRGDQSLSWSNFSQREDAAVAAAANADLVIFAGGLSARLEGEEMRVNAAGFAGGDRTSLDLPAPQQKLLERLHATGKPVVLVLMNGSAMSVNWADATLPAIIEAWYPGGEGGRAVAELIAGDFNPAGRLPVTFYKSPDQLPAFKDYAMAGRTYRYFAGKPLYAFGHGLSYTRFAYAKPVLSRSRVRAGESVEVAVMVTNTGPRAGDEVVQLYVSHATPGAPIRALQGFRRVPLAPGETREVRFTLDARALSLVDAKGGRAVVPGKVELWVGGGQPGPGVAGAKAVLRIDGIAEVSN